MASKNKLARFAEMETFENTFQPSLNDIMYTDFRFRGRWNEYFENDNPIVLELGCGKGEYTIGLAKMCSEKNFIGIDIKGARIWKGAKQGEEEQLKNACFIRTKIDFVSRFFRANEVDEIWCTFSDPQPKKPNKRLTSRIFINRYRSFLKKEGVVHLKTDSDLLFESTEEQISEFNYNELFKTWNLYGEGIHGLSDDEKSILEIKTFYEKMWLKEGKRIKYVKFQIDQDD